MSTLARAALLLLLFLGLVRVCAAQADELASLRLKAERGNALAQYNLGLAYAEGRQVPADPAEAFAWLTLASESGATGKALDSLLGNISDAQLTDGRRRLTSYRSAVSTQTTAVLRSTPKLAPRGFTLEAPTTTTTAAESSIPLTKAPDAVAPTVATTPGEGTTAVELTQTRKDLEKAQVDLVTATNELATLRASMARVEAAAAESKANETRLAAELKTAQHELAGRKPAASLSRADKSKTETPATHQP